MRRRISRYDTLLAAGTPACTLTWLVATHVANADAPRPIIVTPVDHFPSGDTPNTTQAPVPRASCGPGSSPETGIQGRVPVEERESSRSSQGYWCNMELVGRYGPDDPQGFEGAEWQLARYRDTRGVDCAYYSQRLVPGGAKGARPIQERRGTIVVDVSDPADPRFATNLFTVRMMMPENYELARLDTSRFPKEDRGDIYRCWLGYNIHYCNVVGSPTPTAGCTS
jgi:hypothetical protein